MATIEVRGLRKTYGATMAVDKIDLDVAEGEILGMLGPKTTPVPTLGSRMAAIEADVLIVADVTLTPVNELRARLISEFRWRSDPPVWPEPAISYADYSAWVARYNDPRRNRAGSGQALSSQTLSATVER